MKQYTANPAAFLILFGWTVLSAFVGIGFAEDEPAIALTPEFETNEMTLDLWKDPRFQAQFTQSYIAETEIEPQVTLDELEDMQKIMEYISSDESGQTEGLDKAVKLLQKVLEKNEGASAVFDFTLANIYFQQADADDITDELRQQRQEAAIGYYKKAVEKWPKFRRAWKNMAMIYIREQQYAEAIPALTKEIELGGYDGLTFGLLGFAYTSVENSISAESAYRMAILLDPKTLDWKKGLAQSFFRQGRFAEVAALCGHLIKEYPDESNLWLLQANAYIGMKQPLKAAEVYELLNEMGYSSDKTLNMLGNIYVNEELYEMAVDAFIHAMDKAPDGDPKASIIAAKVLAARAALDETGRLVEHINQVYTDKLTVEQRKDLLKLKARIAVAHEAGEEEFKVLEEIVALDPQDGEALILIGQYHERNGELEMAINRYEQAATIEKSEADAKLRHAQLLVKMAKYKEAAGLLKRVVQLKQAAGKSVDNIQDYLDKVERLAK